MRVLITDNNLGDSQLEMDILAGELNAEVRLAQCASESDVLTELEAFSPDAMIVQWAPITAKVLDSAPDCVVISRMGIGVDMIDLDAARSRDVTVMNVPHYCTEEVATHAISLIFSLNRRLSELDLAIRNGQWNAADFAPHIKKLSSSTVALIGLGRIGGIVAENMATMGAEVIALDPIQQGDGIRRVTLDEIAEQADIISLHAPLMPDTYHLLDASFFDKCQKAPIIVNTSRGALIDTESLAQALHSGRVAAAGIDVFEEEPLDSKHPLLLAPRTLLSAHAAWCSDEALPELRRQTALNVVEFWKTRA